MAEKSSKSTEGLICMPCSILNNNKQYYEPAYVFQLYLMYIVYIVLINLFEKMSAQLSRVIHKCVYDYEGVLTILFTYCYLLLY